MYYFNKYLHNTMYNWKYIVNKYNVYGHQAVIRPFAHVVFEFSLTFGWKLNTSYIIMIT